ncbi:MAG: hypothetical protein GWO24_35120, partial [Akkermansiaceae bacterium]|nr:hypothetical protein [Akkermansiaceae bacterium]
KVASDRGWLDPFPTDLIALLETNEHSHRPLFSALLASNNPNLDALILDIYQRFPSAHRYSMLRQIPRLAELVDDLSRGLWKPGRIVLGGYSVPPGLHIALQQGRAEALEELFTLIHHHEFNSGSNWNLASLVSSSILLPENLRKDRHNTQKVIAWAVQHTASDFGWDPVLRLFVPKSHPNTI